MFYLKKIVLVLIICLSFFRAFSVGWNFPVHDGIVSFEGVLNNTQDESYNYQLFKNWLDAQGFLDLVLISDVSDSVVSYKVTCNTKSSLNLFAGQFTENLIFTISITFIGSTIHYQFSDFFIQEIYLGYWARNKITSLPEFIAKVEKADRIISEAKADKSLSRRERNDIIDDQEDMLENGSETLEKASRVFYTKYNNFKFLYNR